MRKAMLGIAAFIGGFFGLIIGVVFLEQGGLMSLAGGIIVCFGIWGLKWSLTNGLTAIKTYFRKKE